MWLVARCFMDLTALYVRLERVGGFRLRAMPRSRLLSLGAVQKWRAARLAIWSIVARPTNKLDAGSRCTRKKWNAVHDFRQIIRPGTKLFQIAQRNGRIFFLPTPSRFVVNLHKLSFYSVTTPLFSRTRSRCGGRYRSRSTRSRARRCWRSISGWAWNRKLAASC